VIVEFGTAFGVSGMYWLSGLETNGSGHLFTYDPNENWLTVARDNLSAVSSKFTSTLGTFEENVDRTLGERRVDVAFIDAIHTPEFVRPQFELVAERLTPGGVVIVDDIHFSPEMASLWTQLARDSRVLASCALSGRAGLLQLR
jgi:predicted O-methyltransferase YrrM